MAEAKGPEIEMTEPAAPELEMPATEQGLVATLRDLMTKYTLRIAFAVALLAALDLSSAALASRGRCLLLWT